MMMQKAGWNRRRGESREACIAVASGRERGAALLMSLILVVVLVTLSAAMSMNAANRINAAKSSELGYEALFAAESGLDFVNWHLLQYQVSANTDGVDMLYELRDQANTTFGASMAGGQQATISGRNLSIPAVTLASGAQFAVTVTVDSDDDEKLLVTSEGRMVFDGEMTTRRVSNEMTLVTNASGFDFEGSIFRYGVAVNGPIRMTGGTWIRSDPDWEGVVGAYTGYEGYGYTLYMDGGPIVEGPVTTKVNDPDVYFSGGPWLNGVYLWDWNKDIQEGVHGGATGVAFPTPDPSVFLPFVPTYSEHWSAYNDPNNYNEYINTLEFVRIPPNSNAFIGADTTINGIVFVDAPNRVTFGAGATINGVIVTENGVESGGDCDLIFDGGFHLNDMSHVPAESQFNGIRQMTGTAILAPGFDITMGGGAASVGGTIYGRSLTLSGGVILEVDGAVLMTSDEQLRMDGGVGIEIDLTSTKNSGEIPAGFVSTSLPGYLVLDRTTYRESNM